MQPLTFKQLLQKTLLRKYNHNHDAMGRFSSGGGGTAGSSSGGKYKSIDTSDALKEIQSGKSNSLSNHIGKYGELSAERKAIHDEIINKFLEGKEAASGQPSMTMMGGGPASGKSSVISAGFVKRPDEKSTVTIDPDYFKSQLPGYTDMALKSEKAASYYHEESSALAKTAYSEALKRNINVVYDGTGDGSVRSVEKKIKAAREAGYKVNAEYVTVDTEEALRRNRKRYDDANKKYLSGESKTPPRLPDEELVKRTHRNVTDISIECAASFDSIRVYDNNGSKGSTKLIAIGGNGKGLKATDEEAFARYKAKGAKNFKTLSDGQTIINS